MRNAACSSPAAPAPGWPRPTACPLAARSSRWRCCAACSPCASCCRRWSPPWSRRAFHGRTCRTRRCTAFPAYHGSVSVAAWALLAGPIVGLVSVVYVRAVAFADRHKPTGWRRLLAPVLALSRPRRGLDPLPPVARQRPRRRAAGLHRPDRAAAAAGAVRAAPGRHADLHGQRRPRRPVHPLPDHGRHARRGARPALVLALARRPAWTVRPARRHRDDRRHHPGPDLRHRADDGDDRLFPRRDACRC